MLPLFQQDFNKLIENSPIPVESTEKIEKDTDNSKTSTQSETQTTVIAANKNNKSIKGVFKSFFVNNPN